MKALARIMLALACVSIADQAAAHPAPFTFLDIRIEGARIELSLVAHIFDLGHELGIDPPDRLLSETFVRERAAAIASLVAGRLRIGTDGTAPVTLGWAVQRVVADRQGIQLSATVALTSVPGRVALEAQLFPYDPVHQTFVTVYENGTVVSQAILDANRTRFDHFSGNSRGMLAVSRRFAAEGARHIAAGPEHLVFLAGLLLLAGTPRQLARITLAFGLADTAGLALASFNVLAPPARLIEPAIALTIVYAGVDNLLVRDGRDMRAWIALAFGTIHGFGFASILKTMGLSGRALGWSLVAFNLGAVLCQLVVVVLAGSTFAMVRSRSPWAGRQLTLIGSAGVIGAGVFWFIQRVFFPGGIS